MGNELITTVQTMLAQHNTMTVATINKKGQPEAAAVFYVHNNFRLFFFSNPASRHAQNIGSSSYCAVTIQQDYDNWREIKGLQLEGKVMPVTNSFQKAAVIAFYLDKFGFLKQLLHQGNKIFDAFNKAKIYQVTPQLIWLTDNSFGFGKRQKLTIDWSSGDPVCDIE